VRPLTLAHSPDSDDLVMWWPLVGISGPGKVPTGPAIDTGGFTFSLEARDVEELNKIVTGGATTYDITAISAGAYPRVKDTYRITACGASFGEGYGPRVVVRQDSPLRDRGDIRGKRVAVPGVHTSALLTLTLLMGGRDTDGHVERGFEIEEMLFSQIPNAVAAGRVDAGLLIHEAQLTFEGSGLRLLADLGQWWGDEVGGPLPLGLNVVRRGLDHEHGAGTVERLARVLSRSVCHAIEHKADSRRYLKLNRGDRAEWDDDALLDKYLEMYVSPMTLDMGEKGVRAISELLTRGCRAGLCPDPGDIDAV